MPQMFTVTTTGGFSKTDSFLKKLTHLRYRHVLEKFAQLGVELLKESTPKDSGETASSWRYEIVEKEGSMTVNWCNSHLNDGVNVAIMIRYGHATRNGGFVEGIDYITPSMRPLFKKMADDAWKEVIR